ncbi:hypothetical protein QW060_19435 [Myroides ceti]|uniref:Antifreeze protein n=1 Tax=Paenimyroides ceti TaxID=395087 RepID=A0ABT8CZM7_9FLAO|nr:hypothetical protein [Paenimyroides ceti]MDN3709206.1 hypothetical protein [Paenimyroides ceti]
MNMLCAVATLIRCGPGSCKDVISGTGTIVRSSLNMTVAEPHSSVAVNTAADGIASQLTLISAGSNSAKTGAMVSSTLFAENKQLYYH